MTQELIEIVMLEDIPVMEFDDVQHWICPFCNPGYTPGKIVSAICGKLTEDCPEGHVDPGEDCDACTDVPCPKCGNYL